MYSGPINKSATNGPKDKPESPGPNETPFSRWKEKEGNLYAHRFEKKNKKIIHPTMWIFVLYYYEKRN